MNTSNSTSVVGASQISVQNTKNESGLGLHGLGYAPSPKLSFRQKAVDIIRDPTFCEPSLLETLCRYNTKSDAVLDVILRIVARLSELGIGDSAARQLVNEVTSNSDVVSDESLFWDQLVNLMQNSIATNGPVHVSENMQHIVTLVGPTGVGKTTTIAKLAAPFRLAQKRVGLITVDTFRVAAVDQLRTYAEIMDMPMEVVETPEEMRRAVSRLSDQDLIFIDTAGRNPRNETQIQHLRSIVAAAGADEVHLVLSTTSSETTLRSVVSRFESVGCTSMILTKTDEMKSIAHLVLWLKESKLPISYLTHGQCVPDDIRVAEPSQLASLLFGSPA